MVRDEAALRQQVRRIHEEYRQEALVEEFIEGTELSVGVLGNEQPWALPVLEIDFASCQGSKESFYSWRIKNQGQADSGPRPRYHCPARISPEVACRVQDAALRAHRALGCRDLSRTDIRLRADGVAFVLEVNPLAGLDPVESNFTQMTMAAGIPYPNLINHLVELVLARDPRACLPRPALGRGRSPCGRPRAQPAALVGNGTAR